MPVLFLVREGVSCSGPISGPTGRRFVARPSQFQTDPVHCMAHIAYMSVSVVALLSGASGYDAFGKHAI